MSYLMMFKSFVVVTIVLLCTACSLSPKPTLTKRIELSNGMYYSYTCKENGQYWCNADNFAAERSIGEDTQYFCDLGGNFYIIKSRYKGGSSAILQQGLSCEFTVERTKKVKMVDGKEKIETETLSYQ